MGLLQPAVGQNTQGTQLTRVRGAHNAEIRVDDVGNIHNIP